MRTNILLRRYWPSHRFKHNNNLPWGLLIHQRYPLQALPPLVRLWCLWRPRPPHPPQSQQHSPRQQHLCRSIRSRLPSPPCRRSRRTGSTTLPPPRSTQTTRWLPSWPPPMVSRTRLWHPWIQARSGPMPSSRATSFATTSAHCRSPWAARLPPRTTLTFH